MKKYIQDGKFVALAEYFKKQADCSRYRIKFIQSWRRPSWSDSHIYLSLSNKWQSCHRAIISWQRNLRTSLEKYFRFH